MQLKQSRRLFLMSSLALPFYLGCSDSFYQESSQNIQQNAQDNKEQIKPLSNPEYWVNSDPIDLDNLENAFLDFWATWCQPCLKALPKTQKLWENYKDKIKIIGICKTKERTPEALAYIKKIIRKNELTFPNYIDDGEIFDRYNIMEIPNTLFIDSQGSIRRDILIKDLEKILSG